MFGRLRGRLDSVQGQAESTMGEARVALEAAKDLIDDLADGVSFTFEVGGWKIPVKMTLDPREDSDEAAKFDHFDTRKLEDALGVLSNYEKNWCSSKDGGHLFDYATLIQYLAGRMLDPEVRKKVLAARVGVEDSDAPENQGPQTES